MRRLWTFALFCLLAFFASKSAAFPITKITFHGNSQLGSERLLDALKLDADPVFNREVPTRSQLLLAVEHAKAILQQIYSKEGFLYARVDSFQAALAVPNDSAQGYMLAFYLFEGLQFRIGTIAIRGLNAIPEGDLLLRMITVPGAILNERVLQTDISALLSLYEQHGYPLAKIDVDAITPYYDSTEQSGTLSISLRVEEGPRAKIGKIVVVGNAVTDANVITRELNLTPGAYYNSDALESARARVVRLGFFESVAEPELYLDRDSSVVIVLRVKEASTSAIDGVLGYNPPASATESGYLSGLVDLSLRNISGTGRNATLHYDRTSATTQTIEINYLEPWLFGYPLNLAGGFSQHEQDSSFTETAASGDLSLALTQDIRIIGTLSYDRVIPSNADSLPFTTYDSRTVTTGLSASIDTRDNSIAPTSGVFGLLGASYGVKEIYGPAQFIDSSTPPSIGLSTVSLDASGFHTLFSDKIVGMIGLHARSVSALRGLLDASDLFRIGGIFTIRGYREEILLASRYVYGNFEMRFMMSPLSYFYLFVDDGYLEKDSTVSSPAEQPQYPMSYGMGAQVESPLGILAVSIGLAKAEPISQAIFAFGLVKQF
ncbi:MAG TPA: POTRA domain-containing protein [Candidatus Kapabacteria bacterium]